MRSLGEKNAFNNTGTLEELNGIDLDFNIHATMAASSTHDIICGRVTDRGEELVVCDTFDDVKKLRGEFRDAASGVKRLNYYRAPKAVIPAADPGFQVQP